MAENKFDIEQIVVQYWHGANSERAALVRVFKKLIMEGGKDFKMFLAEVAEEIHRNGLQPVPAIACAMMYGMVIGVLAERERTKKKLIV